MAEKDGRFAVLVIVGIVCVIFFSLLLTSYADLHYYEVRQFCLTKQLRRTINLYGTCQKLIELNYVAVT